MRDCYHHYSRKVTTLLLKCASHLNMSHLYQIQAQLITNPPPSSLNPNLIAVRLIGICASHANLRHATLIFSHHPNPNVFVYNAIIKAHVHGGAWIHALNIFNAQLSNPHAPSPNQYIFASILKACANLMATVDGHKVHGVVTKVGFEWNLFVRNSLVDMYFKFNDVIIAGQMFDEMPVKDEVSWNTLVSGYCSCDDIDSAKQVFDKIPYRNVVCWNVMVGGYVDYGKYHEAIDCFYEMQRIGDVVPNDHTLVSVLSACAQLGALDLGKWIEQFISGNIKGFKFNIFLGNALVDMYAKCGSIDQAKRVFGQMKERDVISWSMVIFGLGVHGHAEEAFEYYSKMLEYEVKPNGVTFMGLLSTCNHAGLVDKGLGYFDSMIHEHEIAPKIGHYGCMVDLLSRAGHLKEAEDLIDSMPMKPNVIVWGALLGGCKNYKDLDRGERVARHILELDSGYTGSYVYMAKVNASIGRLDDAADCWLRLQDKRIMRNPGCSRIQAEV